MQDRRPLGSGSGEELGCDGVGGGDCSTNCVIGKCLGLDDDVEIQFSTNFRPTDTLILHFENDEDAADLFTPADT